MFFFGDFIEPARDPDAAPWRWRWQPGETALVRFGARSSRAAGGLVRYSFSPIHGDWHLAECEASDGAPEGHALWHARIPSPPGESACLYEIGYRAHDGEIRWSGRRRPLHFSTAPWRGQGAEQAEVGHNPAGPVSGPIPSRPLTPAPQDWRARMHYAVLTDRFAIGAPERQGLGLARYDPASPFAAHGGDLAGVRANLDYLEALGVGALILSPVCLNGAEGYHGYHPVELYALEPRLGTMDDLRGLVRDAHARNIAVILDAVVNHTAPMIDWHREDGAWQGTFLYDKADPAMVPLCPEGLRDPANFHCPETDGHEEQGRLFGFLDDWRTEVPAVRDALILSLKWWLAETDVDGFRYDAVRHVGVDFWRNATREIGRYAEAVGKTGFVQIGEHSSHLSGEAGGAGRHGGFDGMIDYPLQYAIRDAMQGEAAHDRIAAALDRDCFDWPDSRRNLVFLENHDTSRAASNLADPHAMPAWLALLFLGPGIPMIAQGQEQEFAGRLLEWTTPEGRALVSDAYVRENLFENPACVWRAGAVNRPRHPAYDRSNPTWRTIARLSELRRTLPGLSAGDRSPLRDASDGRHLHRMGDAGDRLLVAINLTPEPWQDASLPSSGPLWSCGEVGAGAIGAWGAALWRDPAA